MSVSLVPDVASAKSCSTLINLKRRVQRLQSSDGFGYYFPGSGTIKVGFSSGFGGFLLSDYITIDGVGYHFLGSDR